MFYSDKKPNVLVYATKDNLVFRDVENAFNSKIYAGHRSKITAIAEQKTLGKIAIGDETGKVSIITLRGDGTFFMEKEFEMLSGNVNQILWSNDGNRIVAIGAGSETKAVAILIDTGSKSGTILGFTGTQLCSDLAFLEKKTTLFTGGEGSEVLGHEGFPFKGQGKSSGAIHSNFINQLKLSPDNTKFATVSSDKSIIVHDVATQAILSKTAGAHEMGIYDIKWLDNGSFATCSADNTIKIWSVAADGNIE